MTKEYSSRTCLVCGRENPVGLNLAFGVGAEGSSAHWVAEERFQGFRGVIHGGVVMALMDDAMWYAAFGAGGFTLTAEVVVRYHAPLRVGQAVVVTGRLASRRGRIWETEAEVRDEADGHLIASARGKFLEAPGTLRSELGDGFEAPPEGP